MQCEFMQAIEGRRAGVCGRGKAAVNAAAVSVNVFANFVARWRDRKTRVWKRVPSAEDATGATQADRRM